MFDYQLNVQCYLNAYDTRHYYYQKSKGFILLLENTVD